MLVVVSPAKKLDFENECNVGDHTKPVFLSKTNKLANELKKLKSSDIAKMMKLSQALSDLNFNRFQTFKKNYNTTTSKQAMYAFNGDTYTGLDAETLNSKEVKVAQKKLRILSGLYGILKPLDLIQPYRLEMGTKFSYQSHKNLYSFWGEDIAIQINTELKTNKEILVNCASQEYFKAVDTNILKAQIITPVFKENRNGVLKIISFSAKRARGMMARYIIRNNIKKESELKNFDLDGYKFNAKESNDSEYVFIR